jgi:hypothetical protein
MSRSLRPTLFGFSASFKIGASSKLLKNLSRHASFVTDRRVLFPDQLNVRPRYEGSTLLVLDDLAAYFQLTPDPGRDRVGTMSNGDSGGDPVPPTAELTLAPSAPEVSTSEFFDFSPYPGVWAPGCWSAPDPGRRSPRLRPRKEVDGRRSRSSPSRFVANSLMK